MFEKIMVVDDDVDIRNKFYEILSSLGYKVTAVPIAKEALLRLAEDKPDLILLDEDMPDLGGIDTAEKIREFDKDVTILVLSDKEPEEHKTEAVKKLNIKGMIKKDFSTHFMMKKILEIIKEKETLKAEEPLPEETKGPVLVVDDSSDIRKILWTYLTRRGYKVFDASLGEEAIMKIKTEREKPKIVLLDLRMPGMDGIMVLRKIKELDESIKVVMLTAAQEEYIMKEAEKEGACDYLVKPCDFQKLDALLSSLLTLRQ